MQSFCVTELTLEQVRAVYAGLLAPAFPENELKPLKRIEAAVRRGEYLCCGAVAEGDVLGAAFFVRIRRGGRTLMLFDYLVVRPDLRCRGIGAAFLQALIGGPLRGADVALLEVDDPDRADDCGERALRRRRLMFYLRNGLCDTGARATVYGAAFRILALPGGDVIPPEQAREMYAALYKAIFPPHTFRHRVVIEGPDPSP